MASPFAQMHYVVIRIDEDRRRRERFQHAIVHLAVGGTFGARTRLVQPRERDRTRRPLAFDWQRGNAHEAVAVLAYEDAMLLINRPEEV